MLKQSAWITLGTGSGTGQALAFSTWVSTYDLGATVLSVLPYANPNVSIATYNVTLGGTSNFTAFLAQADQLSIYNFQPAYTAYGYGATTGAVQYIDSGFNVSGGTVFVNGPGTPPTATTTTNNLSTTALGATTYTFTVNYTDGAVLNLSSLGNANILVSGPNGFFQDATFVSAASATVDSSGYQHTTVTYRITAPSGVWAKGQDGTYTIELLPNQITDNEGNVASDAVIGSFSVDFTLPTAVANTTNLTTASGTTSSSFSITYTDAAGIDTTTLGNGQVTVSGPNGYSRFASLYSQTSSNNGTTVVATYTFVPPGGTWSASVAGTYTISMAANAVYDLAGNAVASGSLGTFAAVGSTLTTTGSISGTVFNDANGNGIYDSRENALTGAQITLVGVNVTMVATTDVNGNYSFTNLPAGRYSLVETTIPTGFTVTTPTTGTNVVTLTAGQASTGINFADQVGTSTISSGGGTPNNGNSNKKPIVTRHGR